MPDKSFEDAVRAIVPDAAWTPVTPDFPVEWGKVETMLNTVGPVLIAQWSRWHELHPLSPLVMVRTREEVYTAIEVLATFHNMIEEYERRKAPR